MFYNGVCGFTWIIVNFVLNSYNIAKIIKVCINNLYSKTYYASGNKI